MLKKSTCGAKAARVERRGGHLDHHPDLEPGRAAAALLRDGLVEHRSGREQLVERC